MQDITAIYYQIFAQNMQYLPQKQAPWTAAYCFVPCTLFVLLARISYGQGKPMFLPCEIIIEIVEEELVDVEDGLDDADDTMLEETGVIVERLVKIIVERKKSECIIFKRVGRKILNCSDR